ncbi:hypothetical protein KCP74_05370 [Salmonella enterica subsp. enterica]|nr:hypothetical protein KCP74_05370 [Salmonella enterica subsp. enterica]
MVHQTTATVISTNHHRVNAKQTNAASPPHIVYPWHRRHHRLSLRNGNQTAVLARHYPLAFNAG